MTRKDPFQLDNHVQLEHVTCNSKSTPVLRSHSFGGSLAMKAHHDMQHTPSGAPVLGETLRARGHWTLHKNPPTSKSNVGINFRKSPKLPKVPRPNRTLLMFESVKNGIRYEVNAEMFICYHCKGFLTVKITLSKLKDRVVSTLKLSDELCFSY